MNFPINQARRAELAAQDRRFDDAQEQRSAIVGDEDGHWLIAQVEALCEDDRTLRSDRPMCFSFLSEGGRAVQSSAKHFEDVVAIEMPASTTVVKITGRDFSTWVFRVDNNLPGTDRQWFDVAYRQIGTGDHLLYLKRVNFSRSHQA